VAAFGTGASRQLQGRGGSPGFRFTLYALLSIVVMFMDERSHWLEGARFVLQSMAYPLQLAVSSPSGAWAWMQESFATRDELRRQNNGLRAQQRAMEMRSMGYEELQKQNAELRGLKQALPPVADHWLVAEVVNVQLNSLRQRVLLDRGTSNGVFKGQAVLDEKGLLGQTLHVGRWSAEVILITDPEHAVPVEIARTGLRTIAVGAGDTASLALPYLPANADVQKGDLLVTSGLGGVFPAGYPVAKVAEVHRDAVQPLAQVRATPLASIDVDREAMLIWFREDHPNAPGTVSMSDKPAGNPKMQPLPAPPKAQPAPAAATASPSAAPTAPPKPAPAATAKSTPKPASGTSAAAPKASTSSSAPAAEAEAPRDSAATTPAAPPPSETARPPANASAPEQQ
jgi:rod shape-determining protein MreC